MLSGEFIWWFIDADIKVVSVVAIFSLNNAEIGFNRRISCWFPQNMIFCQRILWFFDVNWTLIPIFAISFVLELRKATSFARLLLFLSKHAIIFNKNFSLVSCFDKKKPDKNFSVDHFCDIFLNTRFFLEICS